MQHRRRASRLDAVAFGALEIEQNQQLLLA
jgi:hypothetical protein